MKTIFTLLFIFGSSCLLCCAAFSTSAVVRIRKTSSTLFNGKLSASSNDKNEEQQSGDDEAQSDPTSDIQGTYLSFGNLTTSDGTNLNLTCELELERGVPGKTVGGAALAAGWLSILQSGSLALSGAAGLSAVLLAISKGTAGDIIRQVGNASWMVGNQAIKLSSEVGEQAVKVSQNPVVTTKIDRMNSAVLSTIRDQSTTLMAKKDQSDDDEEETTITADDLLRELDSFRPQVYEWHDNANKELDALDMEYLKSSGQYKIHLQILQAEVRRLMKKTKKDSQDSL